MAMMATEGAGVDAALNQRGHRRIEEILERLGEWNNSVQVSPEKPNQRQITDVMPIVIGASAGGMDALKQLVAQFPKDLPAPVFGVDLPAG